MLSAKEIYQSTKDLERKERTYMGCYSRNMLASIMAELSLRPLVPSGLVEIGIAWCTALGEVF